MAEVRWTEEAAGWLEEIYEYIAADNLSAAARRVDGIYRQVQGLKNHPRMGFRYERVSDQEVRILL